MGWWGQVSILSGSRRVESPSSLDDPHTARPAGTGGLAPRRDPLVPRDRGAVSATGEQAGWRLLRTLTERTRNILIATRLLAPNSAHGCQGQVFRFRRARGAESASGCFGRDVFRQLVSSIESHTRK